MLTPSCFAAQQASLGMVAAPEAPPSPPNHAAQLVIRPVKPTGRAAAGRRNAFPPTGPAAGSRRNTASTILPAAAGRRKDPPPTRPVAAGQRKAPPGLPDPVEPPARKVARLPTTHPKSSSTTQGYSKDELRLMQEQIDSHPDRTMAEWRQMAEEYAKSREVLGKSTRPGGKSASIATTLAGITQQTGTEDDSDASEIQHDDDSHENLADQGGMDMDDLEQEVINPEGIPLNEDVLPGEEDFNNDGFLNINVNTTMRDSFKAYCEQAEHNMFPLLTQQQARAVRLLEICRKKRTSLDTYDDVMLWHLREKGILDDEETLKDAGDEYISREKLLVDLAVRYNMTSKYPYTKPTKLPNSGQNLDIVCFDAFGAIESLLTDPRLTDDDFWFFDDDPFADPPESVVVITDLQTGMAYRDAHKNYKKKPNQIVLPILMYLDGANTGFMKNMPITALKMTLGIFTREYRDLDLAWRVLGHVHSVSKNQARAKKAFLQSKHIDAGLEMDDDEDPLPKDSAGPVKDLHKQLDVILESYCEVQEKGFKWDLRYRGKTYDVEFVPFVIFVKCDTQEADQLCGSYTSRTGNVSQLCRYCLCSTEETDNPQASFGFKTVPMVKALVDLDDLQGLKEISQQCIDNAFYKIRFSPLNNRGVHGGTPSEMLHALMLGTIPMVRDGVFYQIGDNSKIANDFEALAMLYGKQFGRQSERGLPKCSFNSGIREGKLNAKEYRGVLLVIATVFRSTSGRNKLIQSGKSRQWVQDWLELCEIVLAWEAFLTQSAITKVHVARLSMKNKYLMWMIKKVVQRPRAKGMGLKLMKYHAITHLANDIMMFGVPLEFDTGSNEKGHKPVKAAARTTQKNEKTFDIQTATRVHEHHILDMGIQELNGRKLWRYLTKSETKLPEPCEPVEKIVTGGTIINIFEDKDGKPCFSIGVGPPSKIPSLAGWDPDIVPFLHGCQEKLRGWTGSDTYKLKICTEQTRNGPIFRGHPMYRGDNHWRDWVMVDWGKADPEPAQIWCFLDLNGIRETQKNELVYGNCDLTNGVFAVVECASFSKLGNNEPRSRLFEPLVKEMRPTGTGATRARKFYLVDTEAIAEPCFVIPDVGSSGGKSYFRVKSREEWIHCFEDWLDEPYPQEYLADKEGRQFETNNV